MAKPGKQTRGDDEPEAFIEVPPPTPEEMDEEQLFSEVGAAPTDAVVHVYQVKADGEEPKVWRGPPGNFDLEAIAKSFGTGKYRVVLYSRTAAGNLGRKINKVIPYLLKPEEDARLQAIREGRAESGAPLTALTPEAIASAVATAIKAAMPAPVVQQNPLGLIREVGEILRPLLGTHAQPSQGINPLDMLRAMADILKTTQGESADPIDRGVNAGGYDLLVKLIDKFAPALMQATQGQPVPGQPALPAPNPAPAALPSEGEQEMFKLRIGLQFLVAQAESKNEPTTYADVILDNVPEKELKEILARPDWLDALARFEPKVKQHAEWFGKLKVEIDAALAEEQGDAENDAAG